LSAKGNYTEVSSAPTKAYASLENGVQHDCTWRQAPRRRRRPQRGCRGAGTV